jgi:ubiquinone/menaquinone biosynthesis C-methylase UbiE
LDQQGYAMTQEPNMPSQRPSDPFAVLAPVYDRMGFLTLTGQHLARKAAGQPGEQVLDVATGTGTAALEAARMVTVTGQRGEGHVTGLDLSAAMLAQARARAQVSGLGNLSFVEGDAMKLPFPDGSFDLVLCASALFFMPDMLAALREWKRVLRPSASNPGGSNPGGSNPSASNPSGSNQGGRVGFTAFAPGLMAPLPALWAARLATVNLKPPGPPIHRLPSPEQAAALLTQAGFVAVHADVETLAYSLERPEDRWADIESGLEGLPLRELSAEVGARIRAEHLAELQPLFGGAALTVPLPLIMAFGRR